MAGELFNEHKLHIVFCHLIRVILAELIDDDKDTIFYVLTQEAIQQLQRVSVGGQRDQHRGARGFRPPKVFLIITNIFFNWIEFQGAPDADLIFGSGKRAPPK